MKGVFGLASESEYSAEVLKKNRAESRQTQIKAFQSEVSKLQEEKKTVPLHLALVAGDLDLATSIINAKIDAELKLYMEKTGNKLGVTADEKRAYFQGKFLADFLDTVAEDKNSVFHDAAKYGQVEVLNFLTRKLKDYFVQQNPFGTDRRKLSEYTNRKNGEGNTPVHLAVLAEQSASAFYLVREAEADVRQTNSKNQRALDVAAIAVGVGFANELRFVSETKSQNAEGILAKRSPEISSNVRRFLENESAEAVPELPVKHGSSVKRGR
jgi:ankyrin repeat protein